MFDGGRIIYITTDSPLQRPQIKHVSRSLENCILHVTSNFHTRTLRFIVENPFSNHFNGQVKHVQSIIMKPIYVKFQPSIRNESEIYGGISLHDSLQFPRLRARKSSTQVAGPNVYWTRHSRNFYLICHLEIMKLSFRRSQRKPLSLVNSISAEILSLWRVESGGFQARFLHLHSSTELWHRGGFYWPDYLPWAH